MAIEVLQSKPTKFRAIEITVRRGVIVQGQVLTNGKQVKVPESDAADLVHAGQAKYLDETKADNKEKK